MTAFKKTFLPIAPSVIKKILPLFFFLSVIPVSIVIASSEEKLSSNKVRGDATIFIYHHFDDERYPTTNVPLNNFEEQMAFLADNAYNVIPLAELVGLLMEKKPLPEKGAVITIDDGYRTVYTKAWPILKKYGFPFTVFLYIKGVDRGYKNYLTWEQVKEMQEAGVDFQDHGFSHHHLANKPADMNEEDYRRWIRKDLAKGASILTVKLGRRPRFFAIPYGEYNQIVVEEAKKVGYDAIFTQDGGSVSGDTDISMVPREPILGIDWSEVKHFKKVMERVDLPIEGLEPPIAPLTNSTPEIFGARLLYPDRYNKNSFSIYVSELGWQKAKMDGDHVYIENTRPLTRKLNRVMISGKEQDSGQTAQRFWLLVKP